MQSVRIEEIIKDNKIIPWGFYYVQSSSKAQKMHNTFKNEN